MSALPKSVAEHERNLRRLKCVVSDTTPVTLHHCHGGSMLEVVPNPGWAQRANASLQIPLNAKYHIGEFGIDTGMGVVKGVAEWEEMFGSQLELLDLTSERLGYDIWDLYKKWKD